MQKCLFGLKYFEVCACVLKVKFISIYSVTVRKTYFILLETLPKSHIPGAVRFFAGREVEIEEITNAITDESTRFVNIWGSPGFGKTSIAVQTARHLSNLGYPVYFFKLQGISIVDKLLSKILSIFRSNLVDIYLTPEDKLVSLFREITCPVILILDNLDDLLSSETNSVNLQSLFVGFLESNININILVTCRGLLEDMRDQVEGFLDVRIRPLSRVSSVNFVRQLLPSFSDNVVSTVAEISFDVPLAIKLVTSLISENSEEMADKILKELQLPKHRLEHLEQHMQKLFDMPYEQLTLTDKQALISLTVFSFPAINKDAAIDVVSGENGVMLDAIRSLQTLVKKSLIDEDPCGKYYSIHPLIFSFIVDKSNENDSQHILHSAKVSYCLYYLIKFELLNDKFLSGLLVHDLALEDVLLHLHTVMSLALTDKFENCQQHLFRVLSKAEVFLFLIGIGFHSREDIHTLYKLAMKQCETTYDDLSYLSLFTSYYFQNIAFSYFVANVRPDISKEICEKVDLFPDGTTSKLSCYEGILKICNGNDINGIQQIEMSLGHFRSWSDHLLLKCLCLQVLILYYDNLKESSKALKFKEMAFKVCKEIGNCNLFLIDDYLLPSSKSPREDGNEPLILFNYLLTKWSVKFCTKKAKHHICKRVYCKQQGQEMQVRLSIYFHQITCYADFLIASLSINTGQDVFLDKTIQLLENSRGKCHAQWGSEQLIGMLSQRLISMYTMKGTLTNTKRMSVEACQKALDLSVQQCGEQGITTARCYYKLGLAENTNSNHSSALNAFEQAISITSSLGYEHSDFLGIVYFEQGKTYQQIRKSRLAVVSFEKALEMMEKTKLNPESKAAADILLWLGMAQVVCMDYTSALLTLEHTLEIKSKLFSEKLISSDDVSLSYLFVGSVYHMVGKNDECKKSFENALKINSTGCHEFSNAFQCLISSYVDFDDLDVDVGRNCSLNKSDCPEIFPLSHVLVARNNLRSGQYESGIALLRDALEVELNILHELDDECLYLMVSSYSSIYEILESMGESELAQNVANTALRISESQAKFKQPYWIFHSFFWKGRIHYKNKKCIAAIGCFECAIKNVTGLDELSEYQCQCLLGGSYAHKGRYEDALHSVYKALSMVQKMFPDGSTREGEVLLSAGSIAQKMKNRKLAINNFRLAYKMYSKILGQQDVETQQCYLTYVQALMNDI